MQRIAILGSSGHAKVVVDIVRQQGMYDIAGIVAPEQHGVLGSRWIGTDDDLPGLVRSHALDGAVIAVGDNHTRAGIAERIAQDCPGLLLVSAIHPAATLGEGVDVGAGTVIMAGAVVNPSTRIGRGCVINTGAIVDHDCVLSDFANVGPGAAIGGGCTIGAESAIGIGATLIHNMMVGAHSVVGAGSVVVKPIPDKVVAFGSPAKTIRSRTPDEGYL